MGLSIVALILAQLAGWWEGYVIDPLGNSQFEKNKKWFVMPPAPQPCRAGPPPPPISQRPRWIVVRRNNCAVQHAYPLGDGAVQHAYPLGRAAVQRKARCNHDAVQQNPLGTMGFGGHRAGSMGAGGSAPSGYSGTQRVTGKAPSGYSGTQWNGSSGFCGASVTSGFRGT